jgi:hypothetical protein
MVQAVYHFSEESDIAVFMPRVNRRFDGAPTEPVVWAVDEAHQHNYVFPRDCPRVTFYAVPSTTAEDRARLLTGASARYVVAIEAKWLPVMQRTCLYRYELSGETFEVFDAGAGHVVSRVAVTPSAMTRIENLLEALLQHDVELRVLPSLWPLSDAVIASSLQFSNIRMRNAAPRL